MRKLLVHIVVLLLGQATRMYHANRQAEEAVFISAAGSNLTITGGDFNLTPGELDSFSTWSSLFEEADEYSPFIPTAYGGQNCNSNGRKIDYIWVRDYSVTKLNMTAAFLGCPNDHVYLEENFRITF